MSIAAKLQVDIKSLEIDDQDFENSQDKDNNILTEDILLFCGENPIFKGASAALDVKYVFLFFEIPF